MAEVKQNVGNRECGLMTALAIQGGGKTYQNMHLIANYVKDKIESKVLGRNCLIFDTNGEYTTEEFAKNGIPNFEAKRIALKDVAAWCRDPRIKNQCRRIDAKSLTVAQKKTALEYIVNNVINILLCCEDINTYILKISNMEEIVGKLISLRHYGVDVLTSFQSSRAVEPRIYSNSRWLRLHFISDNVDEISGKVPNYTLYKIAQLMINKRFEEGDERFFVYITKFGRKIEGPEFKLAEWENACNMYLLLNQKEVRDHALINAISESESKPRLINQFTRLYYDNPDKPAQIPKPKQ